MHPHYLVQFSASGQWLYIYFINSIIMIKIPNTCITTINVFIAFPDYVPPTYAPATNAPTTGLAIPAVLYYDTQH